MKEVNIIDFKINKNDTGSPEYQVAIFTERINKLTQHFSIHIHDHHSRRGLLMLIAKRKRFLKYLHNYDKDRYKILISKLGLRK